MVLDTMLGFLDREGRCCNLGKTVEKLVIRIVDLVDEIDRVRDKPSGMFSGKCRVVTKAD